MSKTMTIYDVCFVRDSDKANMYELEEDGEFFWVPKSLIEDTDMSRVGDTGYVELPTWWVIQEELECWAEED